jgi:hypothetical protein
MDNQNLLTAELQVDSIAFTHLKETARWARFLSIVGFVFSAIIVLMALFAGSIFSATMSKFEGGSMIGTTFVMVFYLIAAVVYFFLSLYLFRFATKMKLALESTDQENFGESLMNLKMVYRMLGIITIIYLSLLALGIVGISVAALMS